LKIYRKIYKDSEEFEEYLSARFGSSKSHISFEWQGHRWGYEYTSFDDSGDYDLLYRYASEVKLPHELMDLVKAVEFYHAVKAENPDAGTGAWRDAYAWINSAAITAAPLINRLNGLGE
jgi:hypothetical protein